MTAAHVSKYVRYLRVTTSNRTEGLLWLISDLNDIVCNQQTSGNVMDAVEAILSRRSVREGFRPTPIDTEILEMILRCGLSAPSSKNARPWRFHVVASHRLLGELADAVARADDKGSYIPCDPETGVPWAQLRSTVDESAAVLRAAPAAIFVENLGRFSRSRDALLKATPQALARSLTGYGLELIGVGAAVQNMWIAATAHGLTGVFMGDVLIAERTIQKKLMMLGDLMGVLVLGFSSVGKDPNVRVPLDGTKVQWLTDGP
jgi:nitroreductase